LFSLVENSIKEGSKIEWKVFLAKEHPLKTILVIIFLLMISFLIFLYFGSFLLFLSLLILFGALNPYFIPIEYEFNEKDIVVKKFYYTLKRPWNEFRRVEELRNGILLSPFKKRGFLDHFRGVHILFPSDKKLRIKILNYAKKRVYQS